MGLKPAVREAMELALWVTIDDIDFAKTTAGFDQIKIFYDTDEEGTFSSALDSVITLVDNTTEYPLFDAAGASGRYYKAALHDSSDTISDGPKSAVRAYGTRCAYVSSHDVRAELSASTGKSALSARFGHTFWRMAEDASRLIDRMRRLPDSAYQAVTTSTYYFDGRGQLELWLPLPLLSISQVSVEETDGAYTDWTKDTDYFVWPYNELPTLRLDVNRKTGTTKSAWIAGQRRVKVVGIFGVSTTPPEEIRRAVLIQCARWYKRATAGWADATGSAEAGELRYVKKMDPDVEALVLHAIPHEVRI